MAGIMYKIKFETICDNEDLVEKKSDEKFAGMDLLLKK